MYTTDFKFYAWLMVKYHEFSFKKIEFLLFLLGEVNHGI